MQFSGCEGNRQQELIGLYSYCGFEVNDLIVRLDRDFSPDAIGIDGDINDGGLCGWLLGDTSVFTGCNKLHPAGPGDFIPANALVIIQMTRDAGTIRSMETQCQTGLPIYVIRNSCVRTVEAFPVLQTENYQLEMQLIGRPGILFDARFRSDPSLWSLPLVQYNRLGQRSGSNCTELLIYNTWDHLIHPNLSINQVIIQQPDCFIEGGMIHVESNGPVGSYSIDRGVSWQTDSIFSDLDTGSYYIVIRDTADMCPIEWYFPVQIEPYIDPQFSAILWQPTQDSTCSGQNGGIYIDANIGSFGSDGLEYSIDGGLTYSDSARFNGVIEGTYDIVIRDKGNPQCADTAFWTSGPLTKPPEIIGLVKDSVGFCDNGRIEIEAFGNELLYSLDGVAYHLDSVVVLELNTPYTVYVKEVGNEHCIDSMEVTLHQAPEFVPEVSVNGQSAEFFLLFESKGPYTLLWSTGDTTKTVDNLPIGFNYLDITDGWGCSQRYAFFIQENTCLFQISDSIVDATCETPTTSIYLINTDSLNQYTYDWSIDSFDGLPYIENVRHGTFHVDVSYGVCTKRISFTTPVGGIEFVDYSTEPTKCNGSLGAFSINRVNGGQGPYQIDLSGEQFDSNLTIPDLAVGWHHYTITDTMGCFYQDSFEILADIDIPELYPTASFDCDTKLYTVDLSSIQGGTGSYEIRFNNSVIFQNVIEDLIPGHYEIEIVDSSGCSSGIISLELDREADISINRDTAVQTGDGLILQAMGDLSLLENYSWEGPEGLLCDCSQFQVRPEQAGTYTFRYITKRGCEEDLSFYIDILQTNIFIPNSFSPNGDNVNDLFEIFSPNHEVLNLGIYNRWGDKVFSSAGPDFQWSGQIGSKKAEQGVYIYHVLLKDSNGKTQRKIGSITLIR